jgi:hypothetical protein
MRTMTVHGPTAPSPPRPSLAVGLATEAVRLPFERERACLLVEAAADEQRGNVPASSKGCRRLDTARARARFTSLTAMSIGSPTRLETRRFRHVGSQATTSGLWVRERRSCTSVRARIREVACSNAAFKAGSVRRLAGVCERSRWCRLLSTRWLRSAGNPSFCARWIPALRGRPPGRRLAAGRPS